MPGQQTVTIKATPSRLAEAVDMLRAETGLVIQISLVEFLFDTDIHVDIVPWLDECSWDHQIRFSKLGSYCWVDFSEKMGAMEFKLRWC